MTAAIRIDRTELEVSRLAFGTATLHHLGREKDRLDVLAAAADIGVTHFDTAPLYGFGLCERTLGVFLRGRRARLTVASKFGLYPPGGGSQSTPAIWARKIAGKAFPSLSRAVRDWSLERAEASLSESLDRLQTDYLDIAFLHEPDPALIAADDMLAFLEREQKRGRVRWWGLSGPAANFRNWLHHPLAAVVQAVDSLDQREADVVTAAVRPLQFTFGYVASALRTGKPNGIDILTQALVRNHAGAVLFSSRKLERIQAVAKLLEA